MNEVLETIGVDTELLSSKSIFTREETEKIFNCTHQTLKSFEKREWIKPNRFKNRTFYSTEQILRCIGKQIPLSSKVYQIDEWSGIWE